MLKGIDSTVNYNIIYYKQSIMNLKQISLKAFFKKKASNESDSEAPSDSDSEYFVSKVKNIYS